MTYDDWKSTDTTPEPEPAWHCSECGHNGRADEYCGCSCCTEPKEGDMNESEMPTPPAGMTACCHSPIGTHAAHCPTEPGAASLEIAEYIQELCVDQAIGGTRARRWEGPTTAHVVAAIIHKHQKHVHRFITDEDGCPHPCACGVSG